MCLLLSAATSLYFCHGFLLFAPFSFVAVFVSGGSFFLEGKACFRFVDFLK